MEDTRSDSLILAATNLPDLLDSALFRRFDDILKYENPAENLIESTFKKYLLLKDVSSIDWSLITKKSIGLSFAEIHKICENALKNNILNNNTINSELLLSLIAEVKDNID